jgi:hypothetical protein
MHSNVGQMLKLSIFGILHKFGAWGCNVFMDAKQRQMLKSNSTLSVELNPNGLLFRQQMLFDCNQDLLFLRKSTTQ